MRSRIMMPLLLLPLLSACTSPAERRAAEQAVAARNVLVGMPVQTLLACAGVPNRREQVGAQEFFTYQTINANGGSDRGSSVGIGIGGGGGRVGGGLSLGIPLGGSGGGAEGCIATFTIDQGRVSRLVYREDAGDPAACYAVVENCLAAAPVP
jgi:hypothetical protein